MNPFPNNRKRRATFQQNLELDNVVLSSRNARTRMAAPMAVQPVVVTRRLGKRPIDKALITVSKNGVNNTQATTTLATVTNPCTICGLRWSLSFLQDAGAGNADLIWAIVVARDGNSANTLSQTDGATTYAPEQDVLTFGSTFIDNNVETHLFEGTTKTMRKMLIGDRLIFIARGVATNTVGIRGVVQFFCKT